MEPEALQFDGEPRVVAARIGTRTRSRKTSPSAFVRSQLPRPDFAPIHEDFRRRGMTEADLDTLLRETLTEARAQRRSDSAPLKDAPLSFDDCLGHLPRLRPALLG